MEGMTEERFMGMVTDLASLLGWQWVHFRPARRQDGSWYTPVSGPLGKGWPDLVLIRRHVIIFAELKKDGEDPTREQENVLSVLSEASAGFCFDCHQDNRTVVWRPADWDKIEETLKTA